MTTAEISPKSLLLGFVAAAIAVLTVHQAIVFAFATYKLLPPTSVA